MTSLGIRKLGTIRDWRRSTKIALNPNNYTIAYWCKDDNWGDKLNPILISEISGKTAVHCDDLVGHLRQPRYCAIGSILSHREIKGAEIWGSGFLSASAAFRSPPKKIHAIRGPLSRKVALQNGVDCPPVYGDPALLYPSLFPGKRETKYKLGVIPHYADYQDAAILQYAVEAEVVLIDVKLPVHEFIDRVRECSAIASSSLHGIIAADSLGIPSVWIEVADRVVGAGFKFRDYFASVGRADREPVHVGLNTPVSAMTDRLWDRGIDIDLAALWQACPFRRGDVVLPSLSSLASRQ